MRSIPTRKSAKVPAKNGDVKARQPIARTRTPRVRVPLMLFFRLGFFE
jgi:hypothetical protein